MGHRVGIYYNQITRTNVPFATVVSIDLLTNFADSLLQIHMTELVQLVVTGVLTNHRLGLTRCFTTNRQLFYISLL